MKPNPKAALERARLARSRFRFLRGTVGYSALLLVALAAAALTDDLFVLPRAVRFVLFAALVVFAFFAISKLISVLLQGSGLKKAALDLEASDPEIGCVVSTASEYLEGRHPPAQAYEPELVKALEAEAANRLRQAALPYRNKLLVRTAFGGLVLIGFALFLALVRDSRIAVRRTIFPWAKFAYTQIRVTPGNTEIAIGSDQEIRAVFTGRPARRHTVFWQTNDLTPWQSASLIAYNQSDWTYSFSAVPGDIVYRIAGGDAASEDFQIRTFDPSALKALRIHIRPPAYTHVTPTDQTNADVTLVRATRLEYFVTASPNTFQAELRFNNGLTTQLQQTAGNVWIASFLPTNSSVYFIALHDRAGHESGGDKPHQIVVLPDESPNVTISQPGGDIRSDPTNKITLKISASDDYGVSGIKLFFHKIGSPEQTVVCTNVSSADGHDATATVDIDLGPLQLKDYELVAYHAEARDNNSLDGPGTGKSPVYFIENTSKEKPLSESSGGGGSEKINILDFEKQIIADTSKSKSDSGQRSRMQDLAAAQRQTKEYAEIFQTSYVLAESPPEARTEFADAIKSMDDATQALDGQQRDPALKSEESALAHLYQVARLLPEFESQCRGGNCKKIVLEAIEKKAKERQKKSQQDLPAAIARAKQIAAQQEKLNQQYSATRPEADMPTAENGRASEPRSGAGNKQAKTGASSAPTRKSISKTPGLPARPQELAANQKSLSTQAQALADKLRELGAANPKLGNRHAENVSKAALCMGSAADSVARGQVQPAIGQGQDSLHGMNQTIFALEKVLAAELHPAADIAAEDYPKEFESLISDYYRKLSYEK